MKNFNKNNKKIPFNRCSSTGKELDYICTAIKNGHISGNGPFTKKVENQLKQQLTGSKKILLTTSCTHALEMAAILLDIQSGDEVIVPSYTFVSTALAFVMHGAKLIFADIRPDTLNIDETKIESLITTRTRAIIVVHYAGVGCEMDNIMNIANRHKLIVIEDNAHGLYGKYKGKYLGTIGTLATQSFHETKNISCGEGGALIINNSNYINRAEIIREKGTNRSQFLNGQVDKYTWVDKGSSYVISDMLAAFLYAQINKKEEIQQRRRTIWEYYSKHLKKWALKNNISLPVVPEHCEQAYHMFYLIMPSQTDRNKFINYLKSNNIMAVFHYQPLDQSEMGKKFSNRQFDCSITTEISTKLVRLPFFNDITKEELETIIQIINNYNI
jgi:dTDP-4-amino-4,6-dideoxygalactose transaminase